MRTKPSLPENPGTIDPSVKPANRKSRRNKVVAAVAALAVTAGLFAAFKLESDNSSEHSTPATSEPAPTTPEQKPATLKANVQGFAEDVATAVANLYTKGGSDYYSTKVSGSKVTEAKNDAKIVGVTFDAGSYLDGDGGQYDLSATMNTDKNGNFDPSTVTEISISERVVDKKEVGSLKPPVYAFSLVKNASTDSWSITVTGNELGGAKADSYNTLFPEGKPGVSSKLNNDLFVALASQAAAVFDQAEAQGAVSKPPSLYQVI